MKNRTPLNRHGKLYIFKIKIIKHLSRYEQVLRILQLGKRIIEFVIWRLRVFFRKKRNRFDFDRTYWVDPDKIVYCTLKEFNPFKYDGLVLDDEWDRMGKKFNELDVYRV